MRSFLSSGFCSKIFSHWSGEQHDYSNLFPDGLVNLNPLQTISGMMTMNKNIYRNLLIAGLFSAVALTWGTTWMAMKIAVATVPPIFATGLRFLCAAPLLLLLARYRRAPLLFPAGQRGFQL